MKGLDLTLELEVIDNRRECKSVMLTDGNSRCPGESSSSQFCMNLDAQTVNEHGSKVIVRSDVKRNNLLESSRSTRLTTFQAVMLPYFLLIFT